MNRFFLALSVVLLASCASTKKSTTKNESTLFQKWDLVSMNGESITPGDYKNIYIEFSDSANRTFGSGPCNRFFSTFKKSGNNLKLSYIGSTKMACLNGKYNQLENDFFRMLEKIDSYKITDGNLVLMSEKQSIATFASHKTVPEEMVGKWELFYITGPRIAFEGLYSGRKPFLIFKSGSSELSGNTSCNSMSAQFIGKKGKPLFKPGAMTLMACPGEGEQVFLKAFQKVDSYSLEGDTLTLSFDNIPAMKFKKVE